MSFQGFSLPGIGPKRLNVTSWISQTAKIKSITKSFWVSRIFEIELSSRLINYSYSFRKHLAASFFKNKNCCFHDQGNVGHHAKKIHLRKNLTNWSIFKVFFIKCFAAVEVSLAFIKKKVQEEAFPNVFQNKRF